MSKPTITFKQEPPVELNCSSAQEVVLVVTPNAPGPCEVYISTLLQSCTFQNGETEVRMEVETEEGEDTVECTFHLQMTCNPPDEYFTLLLGKAVNSESEESFRKPINAVIKCGPTV